MANRVTDRWSMTATRTGQGQDVVVGIGISQSVAADIETYVQATGLPAAAILQLTLSCGPSRTAIQNGTEAFALAQHAVNRIRGFRASCRLSGTTHLVIAAPNGFTFFLGQLARPLGPLRLYEYAFGSGVPGAYTPSVDLSQTLTL